jgi:hypothetical protein
MAEQDGKGIEVVVHLATSGPVGTTWCVATVMRDASGRPLQDSNGRFAVAGTVGTAQEITAASDQANYPEIPLFLPLDELHLDNMGEYRVSAEVKVWDSGCDAASSGAPPRATAEPVEFCLVRYMFGWETCR